MKKYRWLFSLLLLACAVLFLILPLHKEKEYIKTQGGIFGTFYHISYDSNGDTLNTEILDALHQVDASLSMFNPLSTISRINANSENVELDSLFIKVFTKGQVISKKTNGAFDMTVANLVNLWGFGLDNRHEVTDSMVQATLPFIGYQKVRLVNNKIIKENNQIKLDASAIAKGFGCDQVALVFEKHGIHNYLIEIGGEIRAKGVNMKGKKWTIGIDKPEDSKTESSIEQIVHISNGAIATSGNYRNYYIKNGKKYAHSIDPISGYPTISSILSATIIAPDCMTADAYATACMVSGLEKAKKILKENPELKALLIYDKDGELNCYTTPNFYN